MKTLKISIVIAVIAIFASLLALADDNNPQPPTVLTHQQTPDRPTLIDPILLYNNGSGNLTFVLPYDVSQVKAYIKYDDEIVWDGVICGRIDLINLSHLSGDFEIECRTIDGDVFSGYISL